jgi:hypothetical protein
MTRGVNDGVRRVQQGEIGNRYDDEYDMAVMAP